MIAYEGYVRSDLNASSQVLVEQSRDLAKAHAALDKTVMDFVHESSGMTVVASSGQTGLARGDRWLGIQSANWVAIAAIGTIFAKGCGPTANCFIGMSFQLSPFSSSTTGSSAGSAAYFENAEDKKKATEFLARNHSDVDVALARTVETARFVYGLNDEQSAKLTQLLQYKVYQKGETYFAVDRLLYDNKLISDRQYDVVAKVNTLNFEGVDGKRVVGDFSMETKANYIKSASEILTSYLSANGKLSSEDRQRIEAILKANMEILRYL